jgi:outer membrane protein OmpA-like peptidoglycan-associated protein
MKIGIGKIVFFFLVACVPTKKYDLLVQSMQKSTIEKKLLEDSLAVVRAELKELDSLTIETVFQKNRQIDSLKKKLEELQTNYLNLQKNVFLQIQELQKDKTNYKSQLAQRDSLLSQLIQQSKQLMSENQFLIEEINFLKKSYLSAPALGRGSYLDSLQGKLLKEIGNFIGQEMSLKKQNDQLQLFLAHQLLFKPNDYTLTQDGEFILLLISKVLKNEVNMSISLLNYTTQDMPETDKWEVSIKQSREVMNQLLKNGLAENQLTMTSISPAQNSATEVGTVLNRIELQIGLKK